MPDWQAPGAVVVIGAGVVGVSTAWELLGRGWEVTLLEAGDDVALATSYANGGLLTRAMSDPWNAPGVHRSLFTALFGDNVSITVRASALPSLWSWGLRFMRSSTPARHGAAVIASFGLADYSLRKLSEVSAATGLNFERASPGTLKIFRDKSSEAAAVALAAQMGAHGLRYEILDRSKTLEREPQLTGIRDNIKGSIYFPDDGCGDAHLYCVELAKRFRQAGGKLQSRNAVLRLLVQGSRICGVEAEHGVIQTECVVLAAGNASRLLARQLGVALRIQPVKGYSLTFDVPSQVPFPSVPVIDRTAHGSVVPIGRRLRVVAGAEFVGDDLRLSPQHKVGLYQLLRTIYPAIAAEVDCRSAKAWTALRPMSADGLPYIGQTSVPGLLANTGHGHMGWTQAAGSAALLADLMQGRTPALDPRPFRATR